MKIAMTSLYLPGGSKIGVGYQVHNMANQMVLRGHEVTVFSQCAAGESPLYELQRVLPRKRQKTLGFAWTFQNLMCSMHMEMTGFCGESIFHGISTPTTVRAWPSLSIKQFYVNRLGCLGLQCVKRLQRRFAMLRSQFRKTHAPTFPL